MIVWLLTDASGCAGHAGNQDRTRDNFIYLYGYRGPRHEDRDRRVEGGQEHPCGLTFLVVFRCCR